MKQPLKILYISHSSEIRGAEVCLLNLIKHIDKQQFVPVVVLPDEGPLRDEIARLGIMTYTSPLEWAVSTEGSFSLTNYSLTERVQFLKEIFKTENPDIVHTNTSVVFEGALATAETGVPHVWHTHEVLDGHPSLTPVLPFVLYYKILEGLSQRVIAVSHGARRELCQYLPSNKVAVIHNGIEPGQTGGEKIDIRSELGLPTTAILALNVASISPYKGQENLVRAAALAVRENRDIHYLLAGPATTENLEAIISLARELEISEHIHYLGYRKDIPQILSQADLFVLPSIKEAFPLVILEAMAAGLPVVATDCCGPDEMIEDGVTGFMVPIQDPNSLANRIIQLAGDPEMRREFGEKAQLVFQEKFGTKPYVAAFVELYEDIVSNKTPPTSDGLSEALVETHEKLIQQVKVIKKYEQKNTALEKTIHDIYNSKSWKFTAPLRHLLKATSIANKDNKF